jgi:hypothetical protein
VCKKAIVGSSFFPIEENIYHTNPILLLLLASRWLFFSFRSFQVTTYQDDMTSLNYRTAFAYISKTVQFKDLFKSAPAKLA